MTTPTGKLDMRSATERFNESVNAEVRRMMREVVDAHTFPTEPCESMEFRNGEPPQKRCAACSGTGWVIQDGMRDECPMCDEPDGTGSGSLSFSESYCSWIDANREHIERMIEHGKFP